MRKLIIVLAVLAFAVPSFAASTTDYLLQRANETHGEGIVTWGNTTPVAVVMVAGASTGTNTWAQTSEVVTLVGGTGIAAAGTQPMMNFTVINANAGTAISGTITWSAADLLTVVINGPSEAAQTDTSVDCSGITLTACVAAATALTWTDTDVSWSVAAGASLPDSSYTDLYEPEAASDLAATAFTVAVSSTKVLTPVAMADGTLYDSDTLDISGLTLAVLETTIEAIYGGSYLEVTIADGLPLDLANSSDSLADKGTTDMEASNPLPFTAGTPPLDVLEEDRYTSVGMCVYQADVGTAHAFEVWDGSTKIWSETGVDSASTYTVVDFRDVLSATGSNSITVKLQGADTMTAANLFCLGRTD